MSRRWDVCPNLFPFGVGKCVDQVEAETDDQALELARGKHGDRVLVFPATKHSHQLEAYGRREPVRRVRR